MAELTDVVDALALLDVVVPVVFTRIAPVLAAGIRIPGGNFVGDLLRAGAAPPQGPSGDRRAAIAITYPGGALTVRARASRWQAVPGGRPPAPPASSRRGIAARILRCSSDYESDPLMRVYVPLTLPGLAEAYKTGELGPGPITAYAVTPGLREWYVSDDIEELEYAALNRAAAASLRLLAALPDAVRRRVVVAVDVPDREAVSDPDRGLDSGALGEVRLASAVPLAKAAAVHVDAEDADADVSAAAAALGAADHGDDDAQFTVDGAEDHELLWYDAQEIPHLVG